MTLVSKYDLIGKSAPFSPASCYSFGLTDSYCIQRVVAAPDLANKGSLRLALVCLLRASIFFLIEHFLIFWQTRRSSYNPPASAMESAVSPEHPGSFLWGRVFRSWELGARCCGVIASGFELSNMVDVSYIRHFTFKI